MVTYSRISLARRRRALSKKGLADLIGVTANTVMRYEAGEIEPSDDSLEKIARSLSFPKGFFSGFEIDEPRRDNASFRGMASKSARIMDAALASGAIAFLLDDWLVQSYNRPDPDILDLQHVDPHTAAMLLRQHWQLGDKPVANMIHLLESRGVRVFSLAENTKDVDAFSLWRDDTPYVFLNRFKSAERSRFDAAHELAHLCLHKHGGANAEYVGESLEKDANAFAGAFLMPETDVRAVVRAPLYGVVELSDYKRRWRVSVAAVNYRLRELNMISEGKSVSNYVEMSRRGWLKDEPNGIAREQSSVLQDIINDLLTLGITKTKIASELMVPPSEIEALLFGLANMTSIDGSRVTAPTQRKAPSLRIIK